MKVKFLCIQIVQEKTVSVSYDKFWHCRKMYQIWI